MVTSDNSVRGLSHDKVQKRLGSVIRDSVSIISKAGRGGRRSSMEPVPERANTNRRPPRPKSAVGKGGKSSSDRNKQSKTWQREQSLTRAFHDARKDASAPVVAHAPSSSESEVDTEAIEVMTIDTAEYLKKSEARPRRAKEQRDDKAFDNKLQGTFSVDTESQYVYLSPPKRSERVRNTGSRRNTRTGKELKLEDKQTSTFEYVQKYRKKIVEPYDDYSSSMGSSQTSGQHSGPDYLEDHHDSSWPEFFSYQELSKRGSYECETEGETRDGPPDQYSTDSSGFDSHSEVSSITEHRTHKTSDFGKRPEGIKSVPRDNESKKRLEGARAVPRENESKKQHEEVRAAPHEKVSNQLLGQHVTKDDLSVSTAPASMVSTPMANTGSGTNTERMGKSDTEDTETTSSMSRSRGSDSGGGSSSENTDPRIRAVKKMRIDELIQAQEDYWGIGRGGIGGIKERIEALETFIYGEPQKGAFLERLKHIAQLTADQIDEPQSC